MHVRKTFWFFILVLVAILLLNQFVRDVGFSRAAAVLVFLIAVSFIWTLQALHSVEVTRSTLEFRQQAGKVFNEQFIIQNRGRLPKLWLEIIDESELGISHGSKFISLIKAKTRWSYATHTELYKRGIYELGPTKIVGGDPFGLFFREKMIPGTAQIMVLPYYEPISSFTLPSGYLPGGKALRTRSIEVTPYAVGVREYQPGDPLRRIDWKSSARLDKLMVKEFEQDPESNVWIFLDASKEGAVSKALPRTTSVEKEIGKTLLTPVDRRIYRLPKDPFEYCISLAAALCDYYVHNERSLGLIMNGQGLFKLTPDIGPRQLDKIFESLAIIKPEGRIAISELIESQVTPIPKGSTLVVITSSSDDGLLTVLRGLSYRRYLPIFIGVNKASFDLEGDNSALVEELRSSGIPSQSISYGDSLGKLAEIS